MKRVFAGLMLYVCLSVLAVGGLLVLATSVWSSPPRAPLDFSRVNYDSLEAMQRAAVSFVKQDGVWRTERGSDIALGSLIARSAQGVSRLCPLRPR